MDDNMTEALRLTRQGRVGEATQLLRHGNDGQLDIARHLPTPAAQETASVTPRLRGLAEGPGWTTQSLIRKGRAAADPASPGEARATSNGLHRLTYAGPAGSRNYLLYVPRSRGGEHLPLVLMLHGGTQDGADFAAGTRMNELAEDLGMLVAYPEQLPAANSGRSWNWFRPSDQHRDSGEPGILAGITREVLHDHDADPSRIYVAGLSAGGAMAAVMAATYPDLYAAVGVHSGLAYGSAHDMTSAMTAMRNGGALGPQHEVPLIVFHGDRDGTVALVNAERLIAARLPRRAGHDRAGTVLEETTRHDPQDGKYPYSRTVFRDARGSALAEQWIIHGAAHAWSGGHPAGSYTDPRGPNASAEMARFFLQHQTHIPGDGATRK